MVDTSSVKLKQIEYDDACRYKERPGEYERFRGTGDQIQRDSDQQRHKEQLILVCLFDHFFDQSVAIFWPGWLLGNLIEVGVRVIALLPLLILLCPRLILSRLRIYLFLYQLYGHENEKDENVEEEDHNNPPLAVLQNGSCHPLI